MYFKLIFETVYGMQVLFVAFGAIRNLVAFDDMNIGLHFDYKGQVWMAFRYELNQLIIWCLNSFWKGTTFRIVSRIYKLIISVKC